MDKILINKNRVSKFGSFQKLGYVLFLIRIAPLILFTVLFVVVIEVLLTIVFLMALIRRCIQIAFRRKINHSYFFAR